MWAIAPSTRNACYPSKTYVRAMLAHNSLADAALTLVGLSFQVKRPFTQLAALSLSLSLDFSRNGFPSSICRS